MIKISSKGIYGVAALFDLALFYGKGCIRIDDISHRQGIPSNYLRQLLITLKKMRFVKSVRGTQGGYVLARQPFKITVGEILESIEGPANFTGTKACDKTIVSYWADCQKEIEQIFKDTLEDLIHEKQKLEGSIVFHI